jgi:hypothetical protein
MSRSAVCSGRKPTMRVQMATHHVCGVCACMPTSGR